MSMSKVLARVGVAACVTAGLWSTAAGEALAKKPPAPTYTQVKGSPDPVSQEQSFTITALECDREADVHATGTIVFKDTTTHKHLGSAELKPSAKFVNCSEASIIDEEPLADGSYKITAKYKPGGTTPIAASKGKFTESVVS